MAEARQLHTAMLNWPIAPQPHQWRTARRMIDSLAAALTAALEWKQHLLGELNAAERHVTILQQIAEGYATEIVVLRERAERSEVDAETERMRLAACGVAAHGGSVEDCKPEYRSDALDGVLALRAEIEALREDKARLARLDWRDV